MEGNELVAFQMISAAGTARGLYVEAVNLAREGKFAEAEKKIKEGDECYVEGHKAHGELLTKMANGEELVMDILMVHAEDQMMATETYKMFAEEIISLYQRLEK